MTVPEECLDATAGGAIVRVHVQPRAARSMVVGMCGDALRVHVQAPAVDGRATDATRRLLAETFGLTRGRVELVSGARSRRKRFRLAGLAPADAAARLGSELRRQQT